ncbi:hypothetical protein HDU96_004052, partial [Phlyctochytrium bullatum]
SFVDALTLLDDNDDMFPMLNTKHHPHTTPSVFRRTSFNNLSPSTTTTTTTTTTITPPALAAAASFPSPEPTPLLACFHQKQHTSPMISGASPDDSLAFIVNATDNDDVNMTDVMIAPAADVVATTGDNDVFHTLLPPNDAAMSMLTMAGDQGAWASPVITHDDCFLTDLLSFNTHADRHNPPTTIRTRQPAVALELPLSVYTMLMQNAAALAVMQQAAAQPPRARTPTPPPVVVPSTPCIVPSTPAPVTTTTPGPAKAIPAAAPGAPRRPRPRATTTTIAAASGTFTRPRPRTTPSPTPTPTPTPSPSPTICIDWTRHAAETEKDWTTRLARHILTRTDIRGDRVFACPHQGCGQTAKRRYNVQTHLRTHMEQRDQVVCAGCGNGYKRKYELERHVKRKGCGEI